MYNRRNTQETSDDGCLEGGELGVNKNPGKGGKLFPHLGILCDVHVWPIILMQTRVLLCVKRKYK